MPIKFIKENEKTEQQIKQHILDLHDKRKDTMHLAHEEFNKGIKFMSDYVLEYISTKKMKKPSLKARIKLWVLRKLM